MIQMKDVGFQYKKGTPVLKDISVNFEPGHVYGLLGLNGAGKTSLMKLVVGAQFSKTGVCTTLGYNAMQRDRRMLEDLFFLPQELQLTGNNRALDIVLREVAPFYPCFSKELFLKYLQQFGITHDGCLNKLSYGERRIVEICAALAARTSLVLLDEPTNGLDIPRRDIFRKIAASCCNDDCCMMISTHQIKDVENLVDSIVILHDHTIILCEDLFKLSTHLRISHEAEEPLANTLIYKEKSIGGWLTVHEQENPAGESMDLEVLFKAAISAPEKLRKFFTKEQV